MSRRCWQGANVAEKGQGHPGSWDSASPCWVPVGLCCSPVGPCVLGSGTTSTHPSPAAQAGEPPQLAVSICSLPRAHALPSVLPQSRHQYGKERGRGQGEESRVGRAVPARDRLGQSCGARAGARTQLITQHHSLRCPVLSHLLKHMLQKLKMSLPTASLCSVIKKSKC